MLQIIGFILLLAILLLLGLFGPTIILLVGVYIIDFIKIIKDKRKHNLEKKLSLKDINKEITGPLAYGKYDFLKTADYMLVAP